MIAFGLELASLQDRPFSAAVSVYISREAWETHFQHRYTGYLTTSGQETLYETCVFVRNCIIHNLQLHVHFYSAMRHSTIDLSVTASDTQTFSCRVPEHQGTGDFMRSECMKLVLVSSHLHYVTNLHMFSSACALALSSHTFCDILAACSPYPRAYRLYRRGHETAIVTIDRPSCPAQKEHPTLGNG